MSEKRNPGNELQKIPLKKLNPLIKGYLAYCVFASICFVILIVLLILNKFGVILPPNTLLTNLLFLFLGLSLIAFAYILPVSVLILGVWSIVYKESAIKPLYSTHVHQGKTAIILGGLYITLGLFLAWGVTGILISFCNTNFCQNFPNFIKFF